MFHIKSYFYTLIIWIQTGFYQCFTLQGNNNLVTEFNDQKLVVAICNRNSHQIPVVSNLRPK